MRIVSIVDLAALVRGRRLDLGLSQGDLAKKADVSRKWINEFEAGGKATAVVGHVLRVLEALDLSLDAAPDRPAPGGVDIDLDAILNQHRRG